MSEAVTGTDILRRTVKARDSKGCALKAIAREVEGIGVTTLEAFAAGKVDLSVEILKALTKVLYPHSEFDAEKNLLCSANKQVAKPFVHPARFDPRSSQYYFPHTDEPRIGPQPVKPEPVKPKGPRPGWA